MVPVYPVCLVLLMFTSYLHGEAIGNIQSYFGSRANLGVVQNNNFSGVSGSSRLKCFALCATYFNSKHLVFFDEKIERAYDLRLQRHFEKHRLKCAPVAATHVFDNNKRKLSEGSPQGDCGGMAHATVCPPGEQKLSRKDHTELDSSSNEDPPNDKVDVFIRSKYVVTTETGKDPDANTNANVNVKLTGEAASHKLFLLNYGYDMDKGRKGTFKFTSPCSIGKITRMSVMMSTLFILNCWYCVGIELRRELEYTQHSEIEVFYSNVSSWLPSQSHISAFPKYTKELAYTRLEAYRKDFRSGKITTCC